VWGGVGWGGVEGRETDGLVLVTRGGALNLGRGASCLLERVCRCQCVVSAGACVPCQCVCASVWCHRSLSVFFVACVAEVECSR